MSKISFSFRFLGSNFFLFFLIFILKLSDVLTLPFNQVNFVLVSSLIALLISFIIIIPAIGEKKETFLLQILVLTILQLLLMLLICAYEINFWEELSQQVILFQLIPFVWLLITQTILLYKHSRID
ncbi:MAG: hypothetical protein FJX84_04155 [Bacteroidetes bacterium]|nr:hypothetical protein [Bacteroidota bacterium]